MNFVHVFGGFLEIWSPHSCVRHECWIWVLKINMKSLSYVVMINIVSIMRYYYFDIILECFVQSTKNRKINVKLYFLLIICLLGK